MTSLEEILLHAHNFTLKMNFWVIKIVAFFFFLEGYGYLFQP